MRNVHAEVLVSQVGYLQYRSGARYRPPLLVHHFLGQRCHDTAGHNLRLGTSPLESALPLLCPPLG